MDSLRQEDDLIPGYNMTLQKKERIKQFGEVFTPPHIVKEMCDMLEKENPQAFQPSMTFLEPTCGDGAFVVEIYKRKFDKCYERRDYKTALESVYAMEIQADNVQKTINAVIALCKQYFKPSKKEIEIINDHIIQADSLKVMRMINNMDFRGDFL